MENFEILWLLSKEVNTSKSPNSSKPYAMKIEGLK